ncbi:hypothetical protein [Paenibacillus humicola]|uniref:hypothetical protein n=1 Tax=Paenibacillus humicola TaxID=3110540 RepID=UPI00237BFEBD|nr:hypothetical protein [Paenibacillus humicola]
MKKNKWMKWQAGMVFAAGIAVMFQAARTSAPYEAKVAAAASPQDRPGMQQQQDPVFDEWENGGQHARGRHFRGGDSYGSGSNDGSSGGSLYGGGSAPAEPFGDGGPLGSGRSGAHSRTGRS